MKNYGITFIGKHTVVCLRLNVSSIDTKYMEERFPDLIYDYYSYMGRDVVRLEGCVKNTEDFHLHYDYAKARAKANHADLHRLEDMIRERKRTKGFIRATINGVKSLVKIDNIL